MRSRIWEKSRLLRKTIHVIYEEKQKHQKSFHFQFALAIKKSFQYTI